MLVSRSPLADGDALGEDMYMCYCMRPILSRVTESNIGLRMLKPLPYLQQCYGISIWSLMQRVRDGL